MDVLRLLPALPRAVPLARRQPQGLQVHRREHRLKGLCRSIITILFHYVLFVDGVCRSFNKYSIYLHLFP